MFNSDFVKRLPIPDSDFDFAAADFFKSIDSVESAAKAYIEIAQLSLKADKCQFTKRAIELLTELNYKDTAELKLIKSDLLKPYNKRSFISEKIVNSVIRYLKNKKETIPVIDSHNHINLGELLYERNLIFLSKDEYLKAILSESILDQQALVKNLWKRISAEDQNWAIEIFSYIVKSTKISNDIIEYINLLTDNKFHDKSKIQKSNDRNINEIHFSQKTEFKKKEDESIQLTVNSASKDKLTTNNKSLSLETLDEIKKKEDDRNIQKKFVEDNLTLKEQQKKKKLINNQENLAFTTLDKIKEKENQKENDNEDFNIDFL